MKIFSPILKGTTTVSQGTTNLSGSFTGSLLGTAATASYADNFTVGGTLTAQTINVQIITSSIEFNTGSTRNGSSTANTHQFTGSVLMSSSLGIGTSSPSSRLDIAWGGYQTQGGAINIGADIGNLTTRTNNTTKYGIISAVPYTNADKPIELLTYYSNNTEKVCSIGGQGNTDFAGLNSISFLTTSSLTQPGAVRMTITSAGNVGIGTTSVTTNKLVVEGYGTANSIMTYPVAKFYGSGTGGVNIGTDGTVAMIATDSSGADLTFLTRVSGVFYERMRITSAGYFYAGDGFSNPAHRINLKVSQGTLVLTVSGYDTATNDTARFFASSGASPNSAATALWLSRNDSTNRSINAGGTINASGADYAEYMTKSVNDTINKGDIVGVDINGKLTNIFADSISFVVKSTDPSYVGGDVWGNEEVIGKKPLKTEDQTEEEFAIINEVFEAKLEEARSKVDRISFSGQVPCNVLGANVGDYIIPIQTEDGKITGQAVTSPSFEQYQLSVGKVWKIMEDGRAWIAVKIG